MNDAVTRLVVAVAGRGWLWLAVAGFGQLGRSWLMLLLNGSVQRAYSKLLQNCRFYT